MNKDIKWLKEEAMNLYPSHSEVYEHPDYLTVEKVDLINNFIDLIYQLDEPEKPVIPQFMAYWIEENEHLTLMYIGFELFGNRIKDKDVSNWIRHNQEQFCRAFLAWPNVEVEKEKLYQVELPTERLHHILTMHGDGKGHFFGKEHTNNFWYRTYLTEQEIKAIDERYWAFAQEVTPCN